MLGQILLREVVEIRRLDGQQRPAAGPEAGRDFQVAAEKSGLVHLVGNGQQGFFQQVVYGEVWVGQLRAGQRALLQRPGIGGRHNGSAVGKQGFVVVTLAVGLQTRAQHDGQWPGNPCPRGPNKQVGAAHGAFVGAHAQQHASHVNLVVGGIGENGEIAQAGGAIHGPLLQQAPVERVAHQRREGRQGWVTHKLLIHVVAESGFAAGQRHILIIKIIAPTLRALHRQRLHIGRGKKQRERRGTTDELRHAIGARKVDEVHLRQLREAAVEVEAQYIG